MLIFWAVAKRVGSRVRKIQVNPCAEKFIKKNRRELA